MSRLNLLIALLVALFADVAIAQFADASISGSLLNNLAGYGGYSASAAPVAPFYASQPFYSNSIQYAPSAANGYFR